MNFALHKNKVLPCNGISLHHKRPGQLIRNLLAELVCSTLLLVTTPVAAQIQAEKPAADTAKNKPLTDNSQKKTATGDSQGKTATGDSQEKTATGDSQEKTATGDSQEKTATDNSQKKTADRADRGEGSSAEKWIYPAGDRQKGPDGSPTDVSSPERPRTERPRTERPRTERPPGPPTLYVTAPHRAPARRPIRTRAWHMALKWGASQVFVRHKSFDAVNSDDVLTVGNISVSGEIVLFKHWVMGFETGYAGGKIKDTLFDEYKTTTEIHILEVGPFGGYRLWDALMGYVRVGFAGAWGDLQLKDAISTFGGKTFSPGFYVAAGIELGIPRRWIHAVLKTTVFTAALRFEGGYTYLGDMKFEDQIDNSALVTQYHAAPGTLTLRGGAIRTNIVLSF